MPALGLTLLLAPLAAQPASAQGKLDARYVVKLAGIPIGRGTWVVEIADDQYVASASGGTSGLLRAFQGGEGKSASRGKVSDGHLVAASYITSIVTERRSDNVRITLTGGNVKDFSVLPEPPPNPDRVPLTEANRRGVTDPMTAALVRVAGTADPLSAEACRGATIPVFDGQIRYDLKLEFKRKDRIKVERGYQGDVLVCGVRFAPLAGHDPTRSAIQYLMKQHGMEVWLAPIAGTRVLAPIRVVVPTPLGNGVLEATQFVSVAQPTSAANAAKPQ
ncbi:MAG: DUF3108 domain-containing protein [Xanthobacteraceae bacterium]|nr:MAG: DUF3108 domain-containing protein [Xanthobacteraceae bacterium]